MALTPVENRNLTQDPAVSAGPSRRLPVEETRRAPASSSNEVWSKDRISETIDRLYGKGDFPNILIILNYHYGPRDVYYFCLKGWLQIQQLALNNGTSASFNDALDSFERAFAMQKERGDITTNSAFELMVNSCINSDSKEALNIMRRALTARLQTSIAEDKPELFRCLSKLSNALGDYKSAISFAENALALGPDDAYSINNCAELYISLGFNGKAENILKERAQEILSVVGKADKVELTMIMLLNNYSTVLYGLGKFDQAKEVMDALLGLLKNKTYAGTDFQLLKSQILFTTGKRDEAIQTLLNSLKNDAIMPWDKEVIWLNLAELYSRANKHDKAIEYAKKCENSTDTETSYRARSILRLNYAVIVMIPPDKRMGSSISTQNAQNMEAHYKTLLDRQAAAPVKNDRIETRMRLLSSCYGSEDYSKALDILQQLTATFEKLPDYKESRVYWEYKRQELYLKTNLHILESRNPAYRPELNGCKADFLPYAKFDPQGTKKIEITPDFTRLLLINPSEVEGFNNIPNYRELFEWVIEAAKNKLGIILDAGNMSRMSAKNWTDLIARIIEDALDYRADTVDADDPMMRLIDKLQSTNGVCRNYSSYFCGLFTAVKWGLENINEIHTLQNIYALPMTNANHAWNMLIELTEGGPKVYQIDLTFDDSDTYFGNNLDALNPEHFNLISTARTPEEIDRRLSRGGNNRYWAPYAQMQKANLLLSAGKHREALLACEQAIKSFEKDTNRWNDPIFTNAMICKAQILAETNRSEEARRVFAQIAEGSANADTKAISHYWIALTTPLRENINNFKTICGELAKAVRIANDKEGFSDQIISYMSALCDLGNITDLSSANTLYRILINGIVEVFGKEISSCIKSNDLRSARILASTASAVLRNIKDKARSLPEGDKLRLTTVIGELTKVALSGLALTPETGFPNPRPAGFPLF